MLSTMCTATEQLAEWHAESCAQPTNCTVEGATSVSHTKLRLALTSVASHLSHHNLQHAAANYEPWVASGYRVPQHILDLRDYGTLILAEFHPAIGLRDKASASTLHLISRFGVAQRKTSGPLACWAHIIVRYWQPRGRMIETFLRNFFLVVVNCGGTAIARQLHQVAARVSSHLQPF